MLHHRGADGAFNGGALPKEKQKALKKMKTTKQIEMKRKLNEVKIRGKTISRAEPNQKKIEALSSLVMDVIQVMITILDMQAAESR